MLRVWILGINSKHTGQLINPPSTLVPTEGHRNPMTTPHDHELPTNHTMIETYLDLGGGGVLEAQGEAAAALLARLLEQHLAVALLVAPPAHVHPLPRRRVAGEEHPACAPACSTAPPQEKKEKNQGKKRRKSTKNRGGRGGEADRGVPEWGSARSGG